MQSAVWPAVKLRYADSEPSAAAPCHPSTPPPFLPASFAPTLVCLRTRRPPSAVFPSLVLLQTVRRSSATSRRSSRAQPSYLPLLSTAAAARSFEDCWKKERIVEVPVRAAIGGVITVSTAEVPVTRLALGFSVPLVVDTKRYYCRGPCALQRSWKRIP